MKKFLLTLMVLGITSSSSAFGYYEVKYMETGAVKNFTPVAFGSNAPWLPGNRERQAQRARAVRRYNAETEAIKNMYRPNINLNINTNNNNKMQKTEGLAAVEDNNLSTISSKVTPKKFTSATCNGITYYSENNPCSL